MRVTIPAQELGPSMFLPPAELAKAEAAAQARALTAAYDPNQERDERGRWTDDGDEAEFEPMTIPAPGGGPPIALKGREDGAGTRDDPIYVDGDLDKAVKALAEGKSIRLDEEKQAAILVSQLGHYAQTLRDQGEKAPPFNLCDVTTEGGSIFCHESLGIPRVDMPQMRGVALDGSPAAALRKDPSNSAEKVTVEDQFKQSLKDSGIGMADKTVPGDMLRATQNEINGGVVGHFLNQMIAGKFDERGPSVWVTKDGYVLDGHHRWAAYLAKDLLDGKSGDVDIKVTEVDMEIGAAYDYAKAFNAEMGIVGSSVESEDPRQPRVAAADRADALLAALRDLIVSFDADFEEKHPRERGRFVEKDGGSADEGKPPKGWKTETPDGAFAVAYRHQDIVLSLTAAAAERVPTEVQHEVMERLASLRDTDPLGYKLSVDVMNPSEMKSKGAAGETFTSMWGPSVIQLSAMMLDPATPPSQGDTVWKKSLSEDVSYHDYLVTHEYGHALQNADDAHRDDYAFTRERIKIMEAEERPSAYGDIRLTNENEAYAEAFADWRLNDEPGALAVALAEHDGWGPR